MFIQKLVYLNTRQNEGGRYDAQSGSTFFFLPFSKGLKSTNMPDILLQAFPLIEQIMEGKV